MPTRPPKEPGFKPDLGFWLWLVGFAKAIADWLRDVGPEAHDPLEQLPDGHPDAAPPRPRPSLPATPRKVLLPGGDDWLKGVFKRKPTTRFSVPPTSPGPNPPRRR